MTSKEKVLSVYPDAWAFRGGYWTHIWREQINGFGCGGVIGRGPNENEAWHNAASRLTVTAEAKYINPEYASKLPSAPSPAGETASEGHRHTHDCILGCKYIAYQGSFDSEYADDPVATEPVSTEGDRSHSFRGLRCVWCCAPIDTKNPICDGRSAAPIAPAAVSETEEKTVNLNDVVVGDPIWAMQDEDGTIRLALDCGDGGFIKMTPAQAIEVRDNLSYILAAHPSGQGEV